MSLHVAASRSAGHRFHIRYVTGRLVRNLSPSPPLSHLPHSGYPSHHEVLPNSHTDIIPPSQHTGGHSHVIHSDGPTTATAAAKVLCTNLPPFSRPPSTTVVVPTDTHSSNQAPPGGDPCALTSPRGHRRGAPQAGPSHLVGTSSCFDNSRAGG